MNLGLNRKVSVFLQVRFIYQPRDIMEHTDMDNIIRRLNDAQFLWQKKRQESAFLLLMIALAALSKSRYPQLKDGEAFRSTVLDFKLPISKIEYRGKLESIEQIFYKWIRCSLVHESEIPLDIQFKEDKEGNSMSIRAGGAPEYVLKIGTGWFSYFMNSILQSKELRQTT